MSGFDLAFSDRTATFLATLIPLLAAHLLADFPFQPRSWVAARQKRGLRAWRLHVHALIQGAMTFAVVALIWGSLRMWWVPVIVTVSHLIIDAGKSRLRDSATTFLLDQAAHIAVLIGVTALWGQAIAAVPASVTAASAFLIAVVSLWWVAGTFIEKATARWKNEREVRACAAPEGLGTTRSPETEGLRGAGLWIGRLERVLIFLFVLMGRFEAIGFLIAAKSVFRFGEVTRPGQRKEAEYILVGTMASFLLAVLIGLGFVCWLQISANRGQT